MSVPAWTAIFIYAPLILMTVPLFAIMGRADSWKKKFVVMTIASAIMTVVIWIIWMWIESIWGVPIKTA